MPGDFSRTALAHGGTQEVAWKGAADLAQAWVLLEMSCHIGPIPTKEKGVTTFKKIGSCGRRYVPGQGIPREPLCEAPLCTRTRAGVTETWSRSGIGWPHQGKRLILPNPAPLGARIRASKRGRLGALRSAFIFLKKNAIKVREDGLCAVQAWASPYAHAVAPPCQVDGVRFSHPGCCPANARGSRMARRPRACT